MKVIYEIASDEAFGTIIAQGSVDVDALLDWPPDALHDEWIAV